MVIIVLSFSVQDVNFKSTLFFSIKKLKQLYSNTVDIQV